MAKHIPFKIYRKGQTVKDGELKAQFGDRYREVLAERLKQLPKKGKERPSFTVLADLPETKGEYDRMQQKRYTTTVDSLIADAFSEIEELANEMREAFDNTPESLQGSGAGEQRGEAADALESLHGDQPDVPDICTEIQVYFLPSKDTSSRSKRASAVQDMLSSAAGEIRSYIENYEEDEGEEKDQKKGEEKGQKEGEEKKDAPDMDELESLADKLEEIGEEVANVTFPGMYG
jgi:hypothetical protein